MTCPNIDPHGAVLAFFLMYAFIAVGHYYLGKAVARDEIAAAQEGKND